ncbi:TetR/AcrR family transcriptional regulator [Imperialibacter sp.]|jgi:AcrR family transcriptional regulator|uniref:TetR/AcrR family transcriptional regulator n=1 Tax=Imperialibacter sp. TaxID=2038411 RepID=UPI0032ED9A10
MIQSMGFEQFTFKKLAKNLNTTESSVYRYFENKHRLLIYLVDLYWRLIEYQLVVNTTNINDPIKKIDIVLQVLMHRIEQEKMADTKIDLHNLHHLVINEGSKSYLTHHVTKDNEQQLFKPYKDLCALIAEIFLEVNPNYPFSRSLTSTVLEMAHHQYFFMHHLPRLTDFGDTRKEQKIIDFLRHLIMSSLLNKE